MVKAFYFGVVRIGTHGIPAYCGFVVHLMLCDWSVQSESWMIRKILNNGKIRSMKHLMNWLYGVGSVLELFPEHRRYHVDRNGFSTDARRLRGDFDAIARDLRMQLKHESANDRSR